MQYTQTKNWSYEVDECVRNIQIHVIFITFINRDIDSVSGDFNKNDRQR